MSSLSLAASDGAEFDDREENDGDVVEDLTPFSPCFFLLLIIIIIMLKKVDFFFKPFPFFFGCFNIRSNLKLLLHWDLISEKLEQLLVRKQALQNRGNRKTEETESIKVKFSIRGRGWTSNLKATQFHILESESLKEK